MPAIGGRRVRGRLEAAADAAGQLSPASPPSGPAACGGEDQGMSVPCGEGRGWRLRRHDQLRLTPCRVRTARYLPKCTWTAQFFAKAELSV